MMRKFILAYILLTVLLILLCTGCSSSVRLIDKRCRAWDTCPSQGGSQFINIPEGYGGKYCSQYPERC